MAEPVPNPVTIGPVTIGRGRPLALIAGPCVMEPNDLTADDRPAAGRDLRPARGPADLQGVVRQGQPDLEVELPRARDWTRA